MTPLTAVVPVKRLAAAKSRLAVPDAQRRALALAFAVDTVTALASSALVTGLAVVTCDPVVAWHLRRLPVRLVPDEAGGLGAAVRAGIRVARSWQPDAGVVVVPADLPCLRHDDVDEVLGGAGVAAGAFVPDRAGTGTTLVVHPAGSIPVTRYGPGSAARHRALGLHALDDAPVRARHDTDTLDDLEAARLLGVGARTAAVLEVLDEARTTLTRGRWQPTR